MFSCKRYKEVFTEGLGSWNNEKFQAKPQVRPGTTPVFHRPQPVTFAVKDAIERAETFGRGRDSGKGDV